MKGGTKLPLTDHGILCSARTNPLSFDHILGCYARHDDDDFRERLLLRAESGNKLPSLDVSQEDWITLETQFFTPVPFIPIIE
jgi:hypothetical protein